MAKNGNQGETRKEILAWGVRRDTVDVHQLALAYYLLARIRLEQRRKAEAAETASNSDQDREAA